MRRHLAGLLLVGLLLDPGPAGAVEHTLIHSTYLGGSDDDTASAIAVDAHGNSYVTGETDSVDFPGAGSTGSSRQLYVAKLDPQGALVYATVLGGSGLDIPLGIAVDSAGHAWVVGTTDSPDFPRVDALPPHPRPPGDYDGFVLKLDPSGSTLLYATDLGGSESDQVTGIALDAQGRAHLCGGTGSADFPVTHRLPPDAGPLGAFIARLAPDGSALEVSTRLGRDTAPLEIAVDATSQAIVAGYVLGPGLPTVNAVQAAFQGGGSDGFVAKLDPAGSALVYSTYLGGSSGDSIEALALDPSGDVWLGANASPGFPLRNPLPASPGTGAALARLDPQGRLVASTFFGSGDDFVAGVAPAGSGGAFLAGWTKSTALPLVDPLRAECTLVSGPGRCIEDVFVARLDLAGGRILFSSYLGGGDDDILYDAAGDAQGRLYLTGTTTSLDFPLAGSFRPRADSVDGFVVRLAAADQAGTGGPPDCSGATSRPGRLWPPDGKLRPVSVEGVTDPDGDPVGITVTAVFQDEPLSKKGRPDATGLGTAAPQVRSDRSGKGDGRVYHLRFTAEDGGGGTCTGEVTVCVPHDRGKRSTCGDGGPLVDSAGGR